MGYLERVSKTLPEFQGSNWLLRIPFAIIFVQQGMSKLPLNVEDAAAFNLPMTVWFFVAYGEIFSGIGLIVGGLLRIKFLWPWVGDLITRFSGVVIAGIMTGVILILEPPSVQYVLLLSLIHI